MKKIKNYILCTVTFFVCLFMFNLKSSAIEVNNKIVTNVTTSVVGNYGIMPAEDDPECNSIFGDPKDETKSSPAYWIQWCLNVMKYVAIAALLLLVTSDFFKALVANDKDAMKKAGTNAVKRFIYCVLIFFLPMLIELIMGLFGAYGTCGIK